MSPTAPGHDDPVASDAERAPTALIVGASRGLGYAMAGEFLKKGWHVIGTVRGGAAHTPLHDLADESVGRLDIDTLDVREAGEIAALRQRLAGRTIDLLFVNAGTATDWNTPIGDVSTDDFVDVMTTNALGPLRVIERLADLVPSNGLIGAMSSGQGSIANNVGQRELYRASKAALNMMMCSYAIREAGSGRAFVLMAPGWVRTDLGGPEARLTIGESVPNLVDVLLAKRGRPGLEYLDYRGRTVPW